MLTSEFFIFRTHNMLNDTGNIYNVIQESFIPQNAIDYLMQVSIID
jgi:hypothetical protein